LSGIPGAAGTLAAVRGGVILVVGCLIASGCTGGDPSTTAPRASTTGSTAAGADGAPRDRAELPGPAATALRSGRRALGTDVFEVWICDVPADTTASVYGDLPLRLPLTPQDVAERAGARLDAYFSTVSHGRYGVRLAPGGTVAMERAWDGEECVAEAQRRASPAADAVLAVANAEHTADSPGGWGRAGAAGRAVYVGASDFHPEWGPVPALDLLQHEIGHTLGLPHSGEAPAGSAGHAAYTSALDVMSNSAAPRDVDPERLDGPDTIGFNRLALGWLDASDVAVAGRDAPTRVELSPSTGPTGTRLLLLPVDEHRVVTVELLVARGFDAHLPRDGVAVHVVDDSTGRDAARTQVTVGEPPFTDLVGPGGAVDVLGWQVEVVSLEDDRAEVVATPSPQVATTVTGG